MSGLQVKLPREPTRKHKVDSEPRDLELQQREFLARVLYKVSELKK